MSRRDEFHPGAESTPFDNDTNALVEYHQTVNGRLWVMVPSSPGWFIFSGNSFVSKVNWEIGRRTADRRFWGTISNNEDAVTIFRCIGIEVKLQ